MSQIRLEGGPLSGLLLDGMFNPVVGLPVDQAFQLTQSNAPFACALYQRQGVESGTIYSFIGFERPDHQPFPIEFVDGPLCGIQHVPRASIEAEAPLAGDGTPLADVGDPAAVAIYILGESCGKWCYRLDRIDDSPEIVEHASAEANEQKLTAAIRNFYLNPDYSIYSIKPTGDHEQMPLEVGWRRGYVDEGIAPLLAEVWGLGLDTLGSCQERPPGTESAGMAYLGFPRRSDAECFHRWLDGANIPSTLKEKKTPIVRKTDPDAPAEVILEFESGNVLFASSDIGRIIELLRRQQPIRL